MVSRYFLVDISVSYGTLTSWRPSRIQEWRGQSIIHVDLVRALGREVMTVECRTIKDFTFYSSVRQQVLFLLFGFF